MHLILSMQSYRVLSPRPAHVATALAHLPRLVEGLARLHVASDAYLKRVLFREIFTAYIEKVLTTPSPTISSTFHPRCCFIAPLSSLSLSKLTDSTAVRASRATVLASWAPPTTCWPR